MGPRGVSLDEMVPPFERFFAEQRGPVYRYLVAAVGPSEADDCFQETFLAALRGYRRLRDDSGLRAWALTIARSKAVDAHRRRGRRPVPVEATVEELPDPRGDVADRVGSAVVWDDVHRLPPKQREAVLLRFGADLTHREVAAVMRCTPAAARRNVHEGVKRLREVVER